MIKFDTISNSRRTPGFESEANAKGASQSPPPNKQRVMIVGQRLAALISTPSFVPSSVPGLNDCVLGAGPAPTFTGLVRRHFVIQITTEAATDIFKWSKDNGATWTENVNAATGNTTLAEGVTIKFGAVTGHKVGDRWTFQAFPAGSVAQKVPSAIFSANDGLSYFGEGSQIHRMVKAFLATSEHYGIVDLNACGMDDGAGVAASGSIQVTGTASAPGSYVANVGTQRFEVGYATGDTAEAIALALKAEFDKVTDLDVLVHRLAGTLARNVFTARHAGTIGNEIKLSYSATPNTGIAGTVVAMANGATDPSNLADALDAFQGSRYHDVVCGLNDATSLATLKTHVNVLSGPVEQKFAIGIFGMIDATLATVTTRASGCNSERMQCIYLKGTRSAPWEVAAAYAAIKGYVGDPASPLNDLKLYGLAVPSTADRITETEIESCLWNGVTPIRVSDGTEELEIVRAVSTYIEADGVYVDITTVCSLDYFRTAFRVRCKSVFARAKNTSKTPSLVRDQALYVARQLEEAEILDDVDAHADNFVAEKDALDPTRCNVAVPSPVVPGLHRICARFDLIY